ncbi:MAG TPA: M24 family metallopeptidase [Alphaproteobacteria bacterium]|jgi:Xaa-Pro aminopeptidase
MINSGERGFNLPTFSDTEKARRWGRVRELMRAVGLDAVIGFPNQSQWDHFQADVRYLTQIGGNQTEVAVVFPLEGDVTAIVRGRNEVEWWGIAQNWVTDIRASNRSWAEPTIARLKELGLQKGRIGISGLSGLARAPEGVIPSGILDKLYAALPDARFETATELMQDARSVKGPEEVEFVRRSCGLLADAMVAVRREARVGVRENVVMAAIWQAIIAGGGDYPSMTHWGAGDGEVPWGTRIAPHRPLQAGDMINLELEAKTGGYIAQTAQALRLGAFSNSHRHSFEVSRDLFGTLTDFMRPGVTFREVVALYQSEVKKSGLVAKGMLLHGRGLGEDRPLISGESDVRGTSQSKHLDLPLQENNVFILKPGAMPPDAADSIRCGDMVVITKTGAERLGRMPFELHELP